uniref:Ciliary neurotrophic factor n=1 Tax=Hucho hucho TaxID=62062 RepID=A0A4W5NBQ7_9TELE
MAGTRTRRGAGSEQSRTARAAALAEELHHECTLLLDLYRKKETFAEELTVGGESLVTVPPLSSQLSPNDMLWRLYSALQQCRNLLERAIGREEAVGNGGDRAQYENQKKTVRDRLGHLLASTRLLLEDGAGTAAFTPEPKNSEIDYPGNGSPFALKLWIYRIFNELEHWTLTASKTLKALHPDGATPKERRTRGRARGRRTRR